jgi:hypothetical protein
MIRVPTLTDQHRQDHACVLIMACRLHPPPPACRDGHRIPVSMRESLEGLLTEFGLDLILDGLERACDTAQPVPASTRRLTNR